MSSQESGVPGGYGARKGGTSGGGRVIEPVVPPTIGDSDGTYTDASGKPITREQAMASGGIDKPGEASTKLAQIGFAPSGGYVSPKPIGLEALKQAEYQASRTDVARRQSEQGTTASEAFAIQRMLRSPTAQFSSQESAQRGYELASRYDRSFAPEQVKATLAPKYQPTPLPSISQHLPIPKFTFSAGKQAGRPTETEFEKRRAGFYTYGAYRKLENVSKGLQAGFERVLGYDERSSVPIKAIAGFGSAFTGLPAFAGQFAGASEAIVRYPVESIRGLPTGFKILSSQITEQATSKPVEFGGSLVGMAAIGRYAPKISLPTKANLRVFARSETASLGRSDPWAKIPTMRQTAQAAGRELSRKIEFGRTFKEPVGTGVASTSGKQVLISIQQTTQGQIQHQGARYARGLQTIDRTSQEFRQSARAHVPAKSIAEQRAILSEAFGELKQTTKQVQITPQKISLIPYAFQKQASKQAQIGAQMQRQASSQRTKQVPVIVQRQKQLYANLPMSIQAQTSAMRSIQALKPAQTTKQAQIQRLRIQNIPPRFESPIRSRRIKTEELPRKMKTTPSFLSKRSSILTGSRKFTIIAGGKTIKQIESELKRKRKI